MYKNMHTCYLQMTNEIFGDNGSKDNSVVKEFEKLTNSMGAFRNENPGLVRERNYAENVKRKYIFPYADSFFDKEAVSQFFSSGMIIEDSGEVNEDYYIDREFRGETTGKYKQETNKSISVSKSGVKGNKRGKY